MVATYRQGSDQVTEDSRGYHYRDYVRPERFNM